ncbi:HPr family phosphocarrier protein [Klugiella xanthotipulae]|uniref:Phosphocarrier protein HPr n=1 Tax=Klugiella xanthotipulae TaxID=244735 RepID=A0A543I5L4_9MICO|nr:HPr family phosphocarrier protein [Klugiella xanthotipulae]TQM65750.1 phosphocarrier protein HPr [Klugiella xanthotipulae]
MAEKTVTILSQQGLHARPASLFAQTAAASGAEVTIAKPGGAPVNAASILGVISLGLGHGDEVTVSVTGANEDVVLADLVTLLETDHDA